jgi:hypothetical protein
MIKINKSKNLPNEFNENIVNKFNQKHLANILVQDFKNLIEKSYR